MKREDGFRAYVIGLTGNIATGKSSVAALLGQFGAHVIDADKVSHQVMQSGTKAYERIVERFGPGILAEDGEINRRALGEIVFADADALRDLEHIVHPAVRKEVDERIAAQTAQAEDPPIVVVEAIKLVEAGMHRHYDALWIVICSPEVQKARLMQRRGLTEREAAMRIQAQPPVRPKLALADVVIDNSGEWSRTAAQVRAAWYSVLESALDKKR